MKIRKKNILILVVIISLVLSLNVFSHSGNTDSLGGHNVKTSGTGYAVGTYHYHSGNYAGWIVNFKGQIPDSNSMFDAKLITNNINTSAASSWAKKDLNLSYKKGLLKNLTYMVDSFKKDITREEFCKLVMNYMDLRGNGYTNIRNTVSFTDLDKFQKDIKKAYMLGIVNGYSDSEFRPKNKITREEIACMIHRTLSFFQNNYEISQYTISDSASISSWAVDEVDDLISYNIINGTSKDGNVVKFSPKSYTTKEQAIILLYRLLVK